LIVVATGLQNAVAAAATAAATTTSLALAGHTILITDGKLCKRRLVLKDATDVVQNSVVAVAAVASSLTPGLLSNF
jgi:hypothetical protein